MHSQVLGLPQRACENRDTTACVYMGNPHTELHREALPLTATERPIPLRDYPQSLTISTGCIACSEGWRAHFQISKGLAVKCGGDQRGVSLFLGKTALAPIVRSSARLAHSIRRPRSRA